jgi:tRNA splicing endonuclease
MMIIGVDYHPSFQAIAFLFEETGECGEQELNHSDGQAEKFYRDLKERGICVRVGMEGGYRIFTLVRATASRVGVRGMDGRSRGDQGQASEEAEV